MSGAVDSWPALSFLEGLRPGPDENVELALLASYSADLGSIGATLLALAGKDTDAGRGSPSDFADAVERLRGKAEMHLKVLVDDTCPGTSARDMTVGQQYLTSLRESAMRQRERQSKARALSVQMHRMFLPIAEEITCKRMDSGKMLLDIAHLIDNKTVERYQNKYSSATQELKECRMQLSGPWPPYHFVQRHGAQHSA